MRRRIVADDRGASLVEFALIAPLLFMLLFGIITGGLVLNHDLGLSTAAREAARFGATLPDNQYGGGHGAQWASAVAAEALNRASGGLGGPGATVGPPATSLTGTICVSMVTGTGSAGNPITVYSPSGGTAYFYSSTGAAAGPCYNDGGADGKRRVQVLLTAPDKIQAAIYSQSLTLTARTDARYEIGQSS